MRQPAADVLVSVFAKTDTGLRRPGNEDAFMVADLTSGGVGLGPDVNTHRIGERGSLMVVSDGMGGAAAGEIASEMAVKTMREVLMSSPPGMEPCQKLTRSVEIANERIWNYAGQDRRLSGMGATLTAVLVRSKDAYIAQVGDSRAYLARGDQIKQLTKDQSLAQLLIESGAIEPDQASTVPQNVIMQALGTSPTIDVALTFVELCRNDRLIVCSDGLSGKVTPDEIRVIAQQEANPNAACRHLVELANERGGEDNITVIVARFDGEELHSAADSNSITGSFKILDHGCLSGDLAPISDKFKGLALTPNRQDVEATTVVLNRLPSESPVPGSPDPSTLNPSGGEPRGSTRQIAYLKLALAVFVASLLLAACLVLVHILKANH